VQPHGDPSAQLDRPIRSMFSSSDFPYKHMLIFLLIHVCHRLTVMVEIQLVINISGRLDLLRNLS
jgi:hypothetical protein